LISLDAPAVKDPYADIKIEVKSNIIMVKKETEIQRFYDPFGMDVYIDVKDMDAK